MNDVRRTSTLHFSPAWRGTAGAPSAAHGSGMRWTGPLMLLLLHAAGDMGLRASLHSCWRGTRGSLTSTRSRSVTVTGAQLNETSKECTDLGHSLLQSSCAPQIAFLLQCVHAEASCAARGVGALVPPSRDARGTGLRVLNSWAQA